MTDASNMGAAASLDLRDLHAANVARQAEWCPDQVPDLSFRGNELAGETGEACNVIKKLERERQGWRGSRATKDDLAQELADVVICADLCAVTAGIDLAAAVTAKFNATSEKQGLSTKLAALPLDTSPEAMASASEMTPDHEFKSHPSVFHPAARGEKAFEYRRDDRGGYAVGQTVRLRCYAPETGYTADPPLDRRITNILRGGEFELPQGYCILSLAALSAPPPVPESVRSQREIDLEEYLREAVAFLEMDEEASQPGTDLYTWLKSTEQCFVTPAGRVDEGGEKPLAYEADRDGAWTWLVWAISPAGAHLAVIGHSEAKAESYRDATARLYPGARVHIERAPVDHTFGASDLRSVAYRAAIKDARRQGKAGFVPCKEPSPAPAPDSGRVVEGLELAMRPFAACVFNDNGDVTISTGNLTDQDWMRLDRAHRALDAAPAPAGATGEGRESFETIAQWCEETFGPIAPARIVSRAAEEMEELRAEPTRVEEAADVVIVLSRYPGLWEAVERKMAVNRKRRWRLMGDGTGYHIKAEPAPSPAGEAEHRGGMPFGGQSL